MYEYVGKRCTRKRETTCYTCGLLDLHSSLEVPFRPWSVLVPVESFFFVSQPKKPKRGVSAKTGHSHRDSISTGTSTALQHPFLSFYLVIIVIRFGPQCTIYIALRLLMSFFVCDLTFYRIRHFSQFIWSFCARVVARNVDGRDNCKTGLHSKARHFAIRTSWQKNQYRKEKCG